MADNTTLPSASGGDTIRDIDRGTAKTQVIALDAGGEAGPESLASAQNPFPVYESNPTLLLLQNILMEMRIMNHYLKNGLNVPDDTDVLRADPYFNTQTQ